MLSSTSLAVTRLPASTPRRPTETRSSTTTANSQPLTWRRRRSRRGGAAGRSVPALRFVRKKRDWLFTATLLLPQQHRQDAVLHEHNTNGSSGRGLLGHGLTPANIPKCPSAPNITHHKLDPNIVVSVTPAAPSTSKHEGCYGGGHGSGGHRGSRSRKTSPQPLDQHSKGKE